MSAALERQVRRIRLETTSGTIEGSLHVSPMLRTLDEVNVVTRDYLTLHDPDVPASDWFHQATLCVRRSSILFAQELTAPRPQSERGGPSGQARAALRLRVGPFHIEGFVHVPRGGTALKRINQGNHPFISLTSVSVLGPDRQFAASFLAVNLGHVNVAQELVSQEPQPSEALDVSFEVS